jgi:hypothetical protein
LGLDSDTAFYDAEVVVLTSLLVAFALLVLLRRLRRTRGDMDVELPIAVGVIVRVLAAIGVSLTPVAGTLRGGDEDFFLDRARDLAEQSPFSTDNLTALTGELHVWLFGLQLRAFDSPDLAALRITQIGIAVAGLALLVAAVHDLAGPRASQIAAWALAVEPTGVFFTGLLHKEANMLLAAGLVAYGGARVWKRGEVSALVPIAIGCLVGIATRPYVGWFLITAGALVVLHAAVRRPQLGSVALLAAVALVSASFVVPFAFEKTSEESLANTLQASQTANVQDLDANLRLEQVDYSTRENIVLNLPQRIRDVVVRPYPWQVATLEQRLGMVGTLVALAVLGLLLTSLWRRRGDVMSRAAPLIYLGAMLLVAYSLSSGNAGTGFRYRTHLIAIAICCVAVLRELRTARASNSTAARRPAYAVGGSNGALASKEPVAHRAQVWKRPNVA